MTRRFTLYDGSGKPLNGEEDQDTMVWNYFRQEWQTEVKSPGRGGYLTTLHQPNGLWLFNQNLADSSGNGLDLSVSVGTVGYTQPIPGVWALRLGGLTLTRASTALLALTGDITITYNIMFEVVPNSGPWVLYSGGTTDLDGTYNYLYQVGTSALGRFPQWLSESGAGVNANYNLTTQSLPPPGVPFTWTTRRQANVVQTFVNGRAFGAPSPTLVTPDGGSNSVFWVGGIGGTGTASQSTEAALWNLKVIPSALSDAQIAAEHNRSLGPIVGLAA